MTAAATIRRTLALTCALASATVPAGAAEVAQPHAHADFSSYTFALTWQPTFCSGRPVCDSDQPHAPLIGLHGLWASLPGSLAANGTTSLEWWQRGCDLLDRSDAAPSLDAILQARVLAVMPHQTPSLLVHEYDKHVQCFAFDPAAFFTTEVAMRDAVASGPFGTFLIAHAGRTIAHAAALTAFETAFATTHAASLSLRCERDATGSASLSEIRIAIAADRLADFPHANSLIDAPIPQDDCPATFALAQWPSVTPGT